MGFLLIGIALWGLVVTSVLLFIWGLWKNSWKSFLISGLAFIIPSIIFVMAQGWLRLLIIVPLISFALAYYTFKKDKTVA